MQCCEKGIHTTLTCDARSQAVNFKALFIYAAMPDSWKDFEIGIFEIRIGIVLPLPPIKNL